MICIRSLRPIRPFALLLAAVFFLPLAAEAQSVDAVIGEMKARYEQQFASVDNYIIETDKYTTYFRKSDAAGDGQYESRTVWKESEGLFGQMDFNDSPAYAPAAGELDRFAENATYGGTETLDGVETHVLIIDNPQALAEDAMEREGMDKDAMENMEGEMIMYIHADEYVPLRMDSETRVETEDGTQTISPTMTFSDYRTTDGLTMPWRMEMRMEDLNASMSPEDREQARESLAQLDEQMKEMSDRQRRMMERMMKGKMDKLRKIVEEGTIEFNIQVQDVKVNTAIPDDVFADS